MNSKRACGKQLLADPYKRAFLYGMQADNLWIYKEHVPDY